MNWYLLFYLISVSERLSTVLSAIAIVSIIALAILSISGSIGYFSNVEYGEDDRDFIAAKQALVWAKRMAVIAVVSGLIYTLVPEKKDYMLIIGGGAVGQYVNNSEEIQGLPDDVVKYLRGELQKAQEKVKEE